MDRESAQLGRVRKRFVELLENDGWTMLYEDEVEARQILKRYGQCNTQYAIADFVLSLLRANHLMSAVELTNDKYRPGTGYVMKKPYGYDLYIKLRFTGSFTDEKVHIMSFHPEQPC
jgi:hypothetical protein